jgi:hypothetical protein
MPPKIPPFELTPAMREAAKQAREFAERPEIKALRGQIAGLRDSLDVPSLTVMAARIKASMEPAPVVRKPRRGRPHGSSPETKADKPLLAEMHDLIGAGKASSISDAAGICRRGAGALAVDVVKEISAHIFGFVEHP